MMPSVIELSVIMLSVMAPLWELVWIYYRVQLIYFAITFSQFAVFYHFLYHEKL